MAEAPEGGGERGKRPAETALLATEVEAKSQAVLGYCVSGNKYGFYVKCTGQLWRILPRDVISFD